jgi:hypothetical protein
MNWNRWVYWSMSKTQIGYTGLKTENGNSSDAKTEIGNNK